MNNLNKKQKIIIGIIVGIVSCAICYYVYAKDESYIEYTKDENTEQNLNNTNQSVEDYSDSTIIVHISGAVNKEGIIEIKAKSRIADAIDKAGGTKEDANLEKINLAYALEDGMKIYIPSINDKEEIENNTSLNQNNNESKDKTSEYITNDSGTTSINNQNINSNSKSSKVNINTATQTELETLPGIGPSTALKIISYRNEKGKFSSIEEIKEVSGIGESKFKNIKELISV